MKFSQTILLAAISVAARAAICPDGYYSEASCCPANTDAPVSDCELPADRSSFDKITASCQQAGTVAQCCAIPTSETDNELPIVVMCDSLTES
ncbi:unnamed protein product [Cercospora beticola]|nr:unnamed protein product [Cercospora beticola]